MSFEFDQKKTLTLTNLSMTTTPKTSKALEMREDSLLESPVDPKWVRQQIRAQ